MNWAKAKLGNGSLVAETSKKTETTTNTLNSNREYEAGGFTLPVPTATNAGPARTLGKVNHDGSAVILMYVAGG